MYLSPLFIYLFFSMSALNIKNNEQIAEWCNEKKIDLVVVGPEDPLANGTYNY